MYKFGFAFVRKFTSEALLLEYFGNIFYNISPKYFVIKKILIYIYT